MDEAERRLLERRLLLWAVEETQGLYLRDWTTRPERAAHRLRASTAPTRMAGGGRWMRVADDGLRLHERMPARDRPDEEPVVLEVPFARVTAVVAAGLEGRAAQVYDEAMARMLEVSTMRDRPPALRIATRQRLASAAVAVVENGLRVLHRSPPDDVDGAAAGGSPARVLLLEVAKIVGLQHLFPEADALPRAIVRARRYGHQRLADGGTVTIDHGTATLLDRGGAELARVRWYDLPRWIGRATTAEQRAEHRRLLEDHDETGAEPWARTEAVVDAVLALDDVAAALHTS